MKKLLALIVFSLLLSFGVTAYSQTPDDMTPAEESICDGLSGAAFGLCNAYCEALDCDSIEGYEQHPNACDKVLVNFMKKTDGMEPPCEGSLCEPDDIKCGAKEKICPDGTAICTKFSCSFDCRICRANSCTR